MTDSYHHGNLKQELIDTAIRIFNTEGATGLSLRKVAAACGVSHAAPYAHFKDKEELLAAMKESVTADFTKELDAAMEKAPANDVGQQIVNMGIAYVRFFIHHPDYFTFLFYGQKITAHLGAHDDYSNDYPPYKLFRDLIEQYIHENIPKTTDYEKELQIIKAWSVVQGISSIVCMENVSTSAPWESYLKDLIM